MLSALFVTSAFSFIKREIKLAKGACNIEASQIYWRWLLDEIKLSSKNAELHKIYPKDSCAVFADLNNDGEDEIIATHYNTAKVGEGQCLLFILEKTGDKYTKISSNIYFDALMSIYIMDKKNNGYKDIEIKTLPNDTTHTIIFNNSQKLYVLEN